MKPRVRDRLGRVVSSLSPECAVKVENGIVLLGDRRGCDDRRYDTRST